MVIHIVYNFVNIFSLDNFILSIRKNHPFKNSLHEVNLIKNDYYMRIINNEINNPPSILSFLSSITLPPGSSHLIHFFLPLHKEKQYGRDGVFRFSDVPFSSCC